MVIFQGLQKSYNSIALTIRQEREHKFVDKLIIVLCGELGGPQ